MKPEGYTWEGTGTKQNPYLLKTRVHLEELADEVSWGESFSGVSFQLCNNLDFGGREWKVIGNIDSRFEGSFDGGGFTIFNLYLSRVKTDSGLFGVIGESGVVERVKLTGELRTKQADNTLGMVAGSNWGIIRDCHCTGVKITIEMADNQKKIHSGLLVGINQAGAQIENCTCEGEFQLSEIAFPKSNEPLFFVGGAAGENHSQKGIMNCKITMSKSFQPQPKELFCAGALTGKNDTGGTLKDCLFTDNMSGTTPEAPFQGWQKNGAILFTESGDGRSMVFTEVEGIISVSDTQQPVTGKEKKEMNEKRDTIITYNTPLYIGDGEEVSYDRITFLPGGYLVFDGDGTLLADEVVRVKESKQSQDMEEREVELSVPPPPVENADIIILAAGSPASGTHGKDGKAGGSGADGFCGGSGGSGWPGSKGGDGANGVTGPTVRIVINNLQCDLTIANAGAKAGNGGNGGNGGAGGNGGNGRDGGRGGDGGGGGDGGDGGAGGDCGSLMLRFQSSNNSTVAVRTIPAKGGQSGEGGKGGLGGIAGKVLDAKETTDGKDGMCGRDGKNGQPGRAGRNGNGGQVVIVEIVKEKQPERGGE